MTSTEHNFAGPVGLQQDFPFFAYAMLPDPSLPAVCITAHEDDYALLCERHAELLKTAYGYAERLLPNWRSIPCIVGDIERGTGRIGFRILELHETDMRALARRVLRGMHVSYVREVDGRRCVIEQHGPPSDDDFRCRYQVWVEQAPQHRGTVVTAGGPGAPEIDQALRGLVALAGTSLLDDQQRAMYMLEALEAADASTAFRAYSHAAVLSPRTADPRQLIALGAQVLERLNRQHSYDNAEWVAGAIVRFARQTGEPAVLANALRMQGISRQGLGLWAEARACFAEMVALLPRAGDPGLEAELRMSYGLVVMDLHAHWETLGRRRRKAGRAELERRLALAERELVAARDAHAVSGAPRAPRNLAFIALELLRIRDLRGDHEGALAAFDALPPAADAPFAACLDEVDRTRYDATVLHYRFCAALKLYELAVGPTPEGSESGPTWDRAAPVVKRLIEEEIPNLVARMSALPHVGAVVDRLCCAAVLVAKVFVKLALVVAAAPPAERPDALKELQDYLGQSVANLDLALELRDSIEGHRSRPLAAGIEVVGLPAIDIEGLLQHALVLLGQVTGDDKLAWRAFAIADQAKGRFFRRDLAFTGTPLPQAASADATSLFDRLGQALLSGEVDHRLLIADREWHLRHDFEPAAAEALRAATRFDQSLEISEIGALLTDANGERTAVLAMYATEGESLAYLLTGIDRPPRVTRVILHVAEVEAMARRVQAEVRAALRAAAGPSGVAEASSGRAPEADAGVAAAARSDVEGATWRTMLEDLLHPMVDDLAGCRRLVIVPHGAWHGLPLHAVLLPALWKEDRQIGIRYAPSLSALHLLAQRRGAMRMRERATIALATVPASEDLLAPFEHEHRLLVETFGRTHRPLDALFGCEATVERVLVASRSAGLRHLLAHGLEAGAQYAMRSGLLLSNGQRLPSRTTGGPSAAEHPPMLTATAELAWPTAASHVTLQACGLGRLHGAFRDELWGMTRALIAGGASSVLAPMWAVDLAFSGELLRSFYRLWLIEDVEPSLALAQAQREMTRAEPAPGESAAAPRVPSTDFAHWAAFQLIGA